MITFQLTSHRVILLDAKINGIRHKFSIGKKISSSHKWIDKRVSGRDSVLINQHLDEIESRAFRLSMNPETAFMSKAAVRDALQSIVFKHIENDQPELTLQQLFENFITEKRHEVNPATRKLISKETILTYELAFKYLNAYDPYWHPKAINKKMYHSFLESLLNDYSVNYTGKIIRRLVTFFRWLELKGNDVNREYKHWKTLSEKSDRETRALNSDQLIKMDETEINELEVYESARVLFNKTLDAKQVVDLTASIKEAKNQAVAMASLGPHKKDFWRLTDQNIDGNVIVYHRGKNNIKCIAPFRDGLIFKARKYANLNGGPLFKNLNSKFSYYLKYISYLCELPFEITASNMRKTFGSIIYNEFDHPNKMRIIMDAYGHTKESTTRVYLGIQRTDLERDHEEMFG